MDQIAWHEDDRFWKIMAPYLFPTIRWTAAAGQVEQLLTLAGATDGAPVLDLCCGPGRHALELAKRGFAVTAVDRTRSYLDEARERAVRAGVTVEFIQEDMRRFRRPESFDLVINLFTSFGYFEGDEDRQVLDCVFESLRPGGVLVIELMGKETIARIFRASNWSQEEDGTFFLEERRLSDDWSRIHNRWVLIREGHIEEVRLDHRLYAASELTELLRAGGFESVAAYGGLEGSPYGPTASRLVVTGTRPR